MAAKKKAKPQKRRAATPEIAFTADEIVMRKVDDLVPFPNNPKEHTAAQVAAIAANIERFGFDQPILVDEHDTILKGHGRQLGARKAGRELVPTIVRAGLTIEEKWAIVISDNALPAMTGFDSSLLRIGLTTLAKANFDLKLTGFDNVRLATYIGNTAAHGAEPDEQPAIEEKAIARLGETWLLGEHELRCADCTKVKFEEQPRLQLADPPYELDTEGGGIQGKRTYPKKMVDAGVNKFAVASIEMHAATNVFFTSKKLIVDYLKVAIELGHPWDLNVLHRSAAMPNNATHLITDLDYIVVIGSMGPQRGLEQVNYSKMLSLGHWERPVPWAKPVEVLTKYVRLFSAAGDLVLDPYCGSGSTIIACEMEKRRCHGIELNPLFVDLAVRRWQRFTSKKAVLQGTKKTFDQAERDRSKAAA